MKKTFKKQTLFIENGTMLEEVKDIFFKRGFPVLWGYVEEDYKGDTAVSSGYLHYEDKMFFLSKNPLEKEILTYDFFKWSLQHIEEDAEEVKTYTEEDLKEAMEYGYDFGFHQGTSYIINKDENEPKTFEEQNIFDEWLNETK